MDDSSHQTDADAIAERQHYLLQDESQLVQELKGEIERLQTEVEGLRTTQVTLLNEDDDVSEKTLKKYYMVISAAMEAWIDEVSENQKVDFGWHLRGRLRSKNVQQHFSEKMGLDLSLLQWLSKYSTCNLLVLSRLIWYHLKNEILDCSYPIGLPLAHETTIKEVLGAMWSSNKNGNMDKIRIMRWKSETLGALCSSPNFAEMRRKHMENIEERLHSTLTGWIEPRSLATYWPRMKEAVLKPTVKLQQLIRCSISEYKLVLPEPIVGGLRHCEYKNLETWLKLDAKNVDRTFTVLSPGLSRFPMGGKDEIPLVKPVVVAQKRLVKTQPSPERHATRPTPSPPPQAMSEHSSRLSSSSLENLIPIPFKSRTDLDERRDPVQLSHSTHTSPWSWHHSSLSRQPKRSRTAPCETNHSESTFEVSRDSEPPQVPRYAGTWPTPVPNNNEEVTTRYSGGRQTGNSIPYTRRPPPLE